MARKDYKGYLIDLDGTLYRGRRAIPEAIEFVKRLQERNLPYLFLTNNASKTPAQIAEVLDGFDLQVSEDSIYTSGMALARYLQEDIKKNHPFRGCQEDQPSIWIVGEQALREVLEPLKLRLNAENPTYVVMGIDQDINYQKLLVTSLAVSKGAQFIVTNLDRALPTERGMLPGNGALVAAVIATTGINPVVVGKPMTAIANYALEMLGLSADEVLLIGDSYDTDIYTGINAGIDTLLVYTGVTDKQQVAEKQYKPTFEADSLSEWEL